MHTLADMWRESNANIERLERRFVERKSDISESRKTIRETTRRRGGRVEREKHVFEHWVNSILEEDQPRGYEGENNELERSP